jgi:hypothetical protein
MRRNTPFRYGNTWRRDEITSRHTVPLGVQEDLKTKIGSTLSLNDKDFNALVGGVDGVLVSSWDGWVLGHRVGGHRTENHA